MIDKQEMNYPTIERLREVLEQTIEEIGPVLVALSDD